MSNSTLSQISMHNQGMKVAFQTALTFLNSMPITEAMKHIQMGLESCEDREMSFDQSINLDLNVDEEHA